MTGFEPGAPERSYKLGATVGVYRAGLLVDLVRWSPASHARGSVAVLYREWLPAQDLDIWEAVDLLIERLVQHRASMPPRLHAPQ